MTLHDETIPGSQETEPVAQGQETAPAPAPKGPRVIASFDVAAGTVTIDGVTLSLEGIPVGATQHLALIGLHAVVSRSANPGETMERLRQGIVGRAPGKPKERDPRRTAWAHAKVEMTKKSDIPVTMERALEMADALDAAGLKKAMLNPTVVKHHAKITGAALDLI